MILRVVPQDFASATCVSELPRGRQDMVLDCWDVGLDTYLSPRNSTAAEHLLLPRCLNQEATHTSVPYTIDENRYYYLFWPSLESRTPSF